MTEKTEDRLFGTKALAAIRRGLSFVDVRREIGRELGMRRNVYRRFIERGTLNTPQAQKQMAVIDALYQYLKDIEGTPEERALMTRVWGDQETLL